MDAEIEYQKVWRVLAANASKLDLSGLDRTDLLEKFMLIKHAGVSALSDAELRQVRPTAAESTPGTAAAQAAEWPVQRQSLEKNWNKYQTSLLYMS